MLISIFHNFLVLENSRKVVLKSLNNTHTCLYETCYDLLTRRRRTKERREVVTSLTPTAMRVVPSLAVVQAPQTLNLNLHHQVRLPGLRRLLLSADNLCKQFGPDGTQRGHAFYETVLFT